MDTITNGRSVLFNNNQPIRLITNPHTLIGFDANSRALQI
jgi:hypothetical protein